MGKKKNIYRLLISKTTGKRSLGKPGNRGMGDVKMDFKKWDKKVWAKFIWFGMGTKGGLL